MWRHHMKVHRPGRPSRARRGLLHVQLHHYASCIGGLSIGKTPLLALDCWEIRLSRAARHETRCIWLFKQSTDNFTVSLHNCKVCNIFFILRQASFVFKHIHHTLTVKLLLTLVYRCCSFRENVWNNTKISPHLTVYGDAYCRYTPRIQRIQVTV